LAVRNKEKMKKIILGYTLSNFGKRTINKIGDTCIATCKECCYLTPKNEYKEDCLIRTLRDKLHGGEYTRFPDMFAAEFILEEYNKVDYIQEEFDV